MTPHKCARNRYLDVAQLSSPEHSEDVLFLMISGHDLEHLADLRRLDPGGEDDLPSALLEQVEPRTVELGLLGALLVTNEQSVRCHGEHSRTLLCGQRSLRGHFTEVRLVLWPPSLIESKGPESLIHARDELF